MDIFAGFAAGLVATVILSVVMLGKKAIGIVPEISTVGMLGSVTGEPRTVDWLIHFLIGTIFYGFIMAAVAAALPWAYWLDGLLIGVGGWTLAGVTLMPAAGKGYFGADIGPSALAVSAMMHLVLGLSLGFLYGWFL